MSARKLVISSEFIVHSLVKFLVISSLFIVFLLLPTTNFSLFITHAQTASSIPTTISPTSPIYTDLLVHNLFHTFSCLAVGQSTIGQPCLTYKLQQDAQGVVRGVPILSQADLSGGLLGRGLDFTFGRHYSSYRSSE